MSICCCFIYSADYCETSTMTFCHCTETSMNEFKYAEDLFLFLFCFFSLGLWFIFGPAFCLQAVTACLKMSAIKSCCTKGMFTVISVSVMVMMLMMMDVCLLFIFIKANVIKTNFNKLSLAFISGLNLKWPSNEHCAGM